MTLQTMSFIFGALLLAVGILGGGFEVKEVKVSNVTTTARIAAAVVGVIFVVLGFWQPGSLTLIGQTPTPAPSATTTPAPVNARVHMGPREEDTDRYGSDIKRAVVEVGHTETCEEMCRNDGRCLSWTYVKPGIQEAQPICYLKSIAPVTKHDVCCVSGTKIVR